MSIEKLSANAKRAIDNEINKINKGLEKLQTTGLSKTVARNMIKETVGYNVAVRENKSGQIIISRSVQNKQLFDYVHKMQNNGAQELHNVVSSLNINTSGSGNKSLDLFKALEDIKRKNEKHGIKQPNISKGNLIKKMSTSNIQMTMINSATNELLFESDDTSSDDTKPLEENEDYRMNIFRSDIETQRVLSDQATFSTVQKKMHKGFRIMGEHYTPYGDGLGFIKDSTGEYFDNFGDILRL